MAERYISLHQILDDILEHPMLQSLSFERAVNHTVHFMRIVGMPAQFMEKTALIDIKDYRGVLPCDYDRVIQVRSVDNCKNTKEVFRHSTDTFHMSENKQDSYDSTYKIQGNIIFTSMKEGTVEISYHAFAVDDEGYPLIPDNSPFIRALELYIKKQVFTILFDQGKLAQPVLQNTQQEYAFAVGQAQSSMASLTIDQMQALTNSLNTLIPRVTEHSRGFVNNGSQERWRAK